jgi:hypothetical protein
MREEEYIHAFGGKAIKRRLLERPRPKQANNIKLGLRVRE